MMVSRSPSGTRAWFVLGALGTVLALASPASVGAQAPAVEVVPRDGVPAGATTLAVSGSGFSTAGNGVYVVFGPVTPAPGYYVDPSLYSAFRWVHAGAGASPVEAALAPDGSFATTLDVTPVFTSSAGEVDCTTAPCAVITFAAHGSPDRSQDTCTLVTFEGGPASSVAGVAPSAPASASVPPAASVAPDASGSPAAGDACALIGAPTP